MKSPKASDATPVRRSTRSAKSAVKAAEPASARSVKSKAKATPAKSAVKKAPAKSAKKVSKVVEEEVEEEPVVKATPAKKAVKKTPAKSTKKASKAKAVVDEEEDLEVEEEPKAVKKTPAKTKAKAKATPKSTAKSTKKKSSAPVEQDSGDEEEEDTPVKAPKRAAKSVKSSKKEISADRKNRLAGAALALGVIGNDEEDEFVPLQDEDAAPTASGDDNSDAESDEGSESEDGEKEETIDGDVDMDSKENLSKKQRSGKPTQKRSAITSKQGVVYLGHIPHGFYETEMKGFFAQFGEVKQLRLSRSTKTGRSRGYAFIQFESAEVASIVQKAMNNYILCDKLLKCDLVAPEKVHEKMFKGAHEHSYRPLRKRALREEAIMARERTLEEKKERNARVAKRQRLQMKKLKKMGVDYVLAA